MTIHKPILALLAVILLGTLTYALWSSLMNFGVLPDERGIFPDERAVCTADAMECSDGSWVGRSGPNCQFVCPIGTSTPSGSNKETLLETKIQKSATGLSVTITPLEIIEDSRCPRGVQCIQAGTVRVRASLVSGLGTANQIFALNVPVTTEAETVTLVAVSPEAEAGKAIASLDYRFVFRVTKR